MHENFFLDDKLPVIPREATLRGSWTVEDPLRATVEH